MKNHRWIYTLFLFLPPVLSAQVYQRTVTLAASKEAVIVSEFAVKPDIHGKYDFALFGVEPVATVKAWETVRGTELKVRQTGEHALITLPKVENEKVEVRLRVEEHLAQPGLKFEHGLPRGSYVFRLPQGYQVESCSVPAQVKNEDGTISLGIVQPVDTPEPFLLKFSKAASQTPQPFKGNFTAADSRTISYQLLDPKDNAIRLVLDMDVNNPGQSHFYSVLRRDDHTSDPVTVDVDRGVEIPTRIETGKEANALGDSSESFPDDAAILVADLGYKIPAGGSARLRSYQTAKDPAGYRLIGPNDLRLDRFIGRAHSQYILPAGWSLVSIDQPGIISTTHDGRVVIDFLATSAQAARLSLLAHRNQ